MLADADIQAILARRVDEQKRAVGLVLGVVDKTGRRTLTHGRLAQSDPRPVEAGALFEIGSITKAFTALLLADAEVRGELGLDEAAADALPVGAPLPQLGRPITLRDLATHRSGLPTFLPAAPPFGDPAWADYTADTLYSNLAAYSLKRAPGEVWEYSNTAYALLGQALEHRTGLPYADLLQARILDPLGLSDTTLVLDPEQLARSASPHAPDLTESVPRMVLCSMAPAGGLSSNAGDLMTFLSAAMGHIESPLAAGFAKMLEPPRLTNSQGIEQAVGWWLWPHAGGPVTGHGGGTAGFGTMAMMDLQAGIGVVALANTSNNPGDIAMHLLRGTPLDTAGPVPVRHAIDIDPATLHRYVGRYEFAPGAVAEVSRHGDTLAVKDPSLPLSPLKASSTRDFFIAFIGLDAVFDLPEGDRPATALTINFGGRSNTGERLPD